jgi:hypothetical protein
MLIFQNMRNKMLYLYIYICLYQHACRITNQCSKGTAAVTDARNCSNPASSVATSVLHDCEKIRMRK